jgi:hypothetical protein
MKLQKIFQQNLPHLYRLFLIFGGFTSIAFAKVDVRQQGGNITYRLEQEPFLSEKSKKELSSGISTQMVILAKLVEVPERTITQQIVSMDAKYNLWDENFRLQHSNGDKKILKTQAELEIAIQNPGPFILFQVNELKSNAAYRVDVIQTINPLEAERLESVRNWVIGQKVSIQAASSAKDQASRGGGADSAFSELFYGLWKRASAGEVLVGEVRRELQSPTFTKSTLRTNKESELP